MLVSAQIFLSLLPLLVSAMPSPQASSGSPSTVHSVDYYFTITWFQDGLPPNRTMALHGYPLNGEPDNTFAMGPAHPCPKKPGKPPNPPVAFTLKKGVLMTNLTTPYTSRGEPAAPQAIYSATLDLGKKRNNHLVAFHPDIEGDATFVIHPASNILVHKGMTDGDYPFSAGAEYDHGDGRSGPYYGPFVRYGQRLGSAPIALKIEKVDPSTLVGCPM